MFSEVLKCEGQQHQASRQMTVHEMWRMHRVRVTQPPVIEQTKILEANALCMPDADSEKESHHTGFTLLLQQRWRTEALNLTRVLPIPQNKAFHISPDSSVEIRMSATLLRVRASDSDKPHF